MKVGDVISSICPFPFEGFTGHHFTYTYKGGTPRIFCEDHSPFSRNLQPVQDADGNRTGEYQWVNEEFPETPRIGSFDVMPVRGVTKQDYYSLDWRSHGKRVLRVLHDVARRWKADLLNREVPLPSPTEDPVEWLHIGTVESEPGAKGHITATTSQRARGLDDEGREKLVFTKAAKDHAGGSRRRVVDPRVRDWNGEVIATNRPWTVGIDHTGSNNEARAAREEHVSLTDQPAAEVTLGHIGGNATTDWRDRVSEEVYGEDGHPLDTEAEAYLPVAEEDFLRADVTEQQAMLAFVKVKLGTADKEQRWIVRTMYAEDRLQAIGLAAWAAAQVKDGLAQMSPEDALTLLGRLSPVSTSRGGRRRPKSSKGN